MKAICIGFVDGNYQFKFEGESPEVGNEYDLEKASEGTAAQRKLFNSLVNVYYTSGQHNDDKIDLFTFRERIKKNLGAGFASLIYTEIIEGKPVIRHAKHKEDIPEEIRKDPQMKEMILGKLKSMSDYSKEEYTKTIDTLISEMLQVEVKSSKFQEILKGISYGM